MSLSVWSQALRHLQLIRNARVQAAGVVMLLLAALLPADVCAREQAPHGAAREAVAPAAEADSNYSFLDYRADYEVRADATSVETDSYDVLLKTKSAVEHFSQVRLGYSEKMERLDVLEAYSVDAGGERHDVPADKIYSQESYSSASAAMYADRKVKVMVFPNLAPGARIVYRIRRTQLTPYFPGYFSLWENFSVFAEYDNAEVTLTAPASLALHVWSRDVKGSDRPQIHDGKARWHWHYRRKSPMRSQNWNAAVWEFSPTIQASTYASWSQMGLAYQRNAGPAAKVTPEIQALADKITAGVDDRREQAALLYQWVARNIRYVAVYLGNGGLEPNSAGTILDNHYGDCKDHTVILEALLAAKGIDSTPVLIGAGSGPTLPKIPVLGRFNHAITYIPEFDLYVDSTTPYARFGQLPGGDLGAPVVHARDGKVARTPPDDAQVNHYAAQTDFQFAENGDVSGVTQLDSGETGEIGMRAMFVRLNAQNRKRIEDSIMAQSGFDGSGHLELHGDPQDLTQPFGYDYRFNARDYVDFSVVGGMPLPDMPGAESMRDIYTTASAETNQTPFYCKDSVREETYRLTFPADVPLIAIPRDVHFSNRAGDYSVEWRRVGQTVVAHQLLHRRAIHGPYALCQPGDYPAFRQLYQQVRRGFRAQILYGDLSKVQTGH